MNGRFSLLVAIVCAVLLATVSLAGAQQDARPNTRAQPTPPAPVASDAAASGTVTGTTGPAGSVGAKTSPTGATKPTTGGSVETGSGEDDSGPAWPRTGSCLESVVLIRLGSNEKIKRKSYSQV